MLGIILVLEKLQKVGPCLSSVLRHRQYGTMYSGVIQYVLPAVISNIQYLSQCPPALTILTNGYYTLPNFFVAFTFRI